MRRKLPLCLLLPFIVSSLLTSQTTSAQSESHNFITYDTVLHLNYSGAYWVMRITRPANMFTPNHPDTASRPVLIHMNGVGEIGSNPNLTASYGPHYWLNHGWDGGIQLGNGKHFPIIITVQWFQAWPSPYDVHWVLDHILATYHIKRDAVHLCGLSMGAMAWTAAIGYEMTPGDEYEMKLISSIVALQGEASTGGAPAMFGHWAKKYGGKYFGLEGPGDYRHVWEASIPMNDSVPGSAYFSYENLGGGSHCCWNTMFDPANANWRCVAPMGPFNTVGSPANTMGNYQTGDYIFKWMLKQGDTSMVPSGPASNNPPTSNAGTDKVIHLPTVSVAMTGSGTDPDGGTLTYLWSKVSGPTSYNIVNPASPTTTINTLAQGVYRFELKVTDNQSAIGLDTVQVTVNAPPTANAGSDQTITLPTSAVTLTGTATDPEGGTLAYQWTRIAGPVSANILNPTLASTIVNGLAAGTYQFRFRVTDNLGAITSDTVNVVVNPAPNNPPTSNAGTDKLITLPTTSVAMTGSGTDPEGGPLTYLWTKVAGPSTYNIVNPASATTNINNLVQGVYRFELKVTDNGGASALDTVQVTVNAPPVSNAGPDQNIALPVVIANLNGTASDPDGTVQSTHWNKISGPIIFLILDPNSAQTQVINLLPGVYQFELVVTDNLGAISKDTMGVTVNVANVPPTANAGADQTITLPRDSVTVIGNGTDTDGSIASYQWTKISGPSTYTILSPTSATTVIDNMVQGVYQFELKVTDNQSATGADTIVITVNPAANIPPTANAGTDQTITLPANTVTLTGSGNDPDGSIANYRWAKISGPSSYAFVDSNLASTAVNNLAQGVYQFELMVTDNQGATGRDTVKITVNAAAANVSPTANAGANQTITLPTNTVTLTGSGNDPDGTIANYRWAKISGPSSYAFVDSNLASTAVNNLAQGVYQFELMVTDNQGATGRDTVSITVNAPAANVPPTSNAGANQTITLPVNTVTLTGSGNDPDGTIANYRWAKISGPSSYAFVDSNLASTAVNNLAQGIYQFELMVTDNQGATGRDTVSITVNAASNVPPTANAGADQTITLPTDSVTAYGGGADTDGTIASYQWTKIAGPSTYTIVTPTDDTTVIKNLVQGTYQFELKVTDNQGATGRDTVTITVNAASNVPPTANAGADQTITLPTDSVTVYGTGADTDGTIASYQWTKIAGPSTYTIVSPTDDTTVIKNLVQGTYQFELKVTDNQGAIGKDTVVITVNAAPNVPPTANAGADQTINLPRDSVTVIGSGIDTDGTIASYQWTKIAGPSAYTIVSPTNDTTLIKNLVLGTYQFELTVTDNQGATGKDTVVITVNPAVNQAPVANAGGDQNITLPTNSINLMGSGTDADGTIATYLWTKIAGPSQYMIVNSALAATVVNSLVQGVYQFELTVTDNQGATGKDTVVITVNPAPNQPPVANAGPDQYITLPTNSISLTGSGTDPDGTIATYQWSKLSGPAQYLIVSPNQATTMVNNLSQGVYHFELTVTDNQGAIGMDTVIVTVDPPLPPPPAGRRIIKPAITEYKIGYLATDSVCYGFYQTAMIPFNTNGKKVKDVTAMFNTVQMLDVDGYIWTTQVYTTATMRYDTTASGAPFNNNIGIYGYFHTMVTVRSDSSLWYFGGDDYNLFGNNNGNANLAPVQLSPVGMKIKKVAVGARLVVLTNTGEVWEWTRGGGLIPVKKVIPRPAIDIAVQQYDANYVIIPDVGGSPNMGYPYVWGGYVYGFWGGTVPLAEPTALKSLWNMTMPVKKFVCNVNTCHYIDSLNRMWGIGDNAQAEVGNGYELVNKSDIYPTPYGWSWHPGEALTGAPPVQIGAGTTWKDIWGGNTLAFYMYASDINDSIYSWGRNKSMILGNGFYNLQEALYPNAMDVLSPTMVHPLQAVYQAYLFTLPSLSVGPDQTIINNTVTLTGTGVPARLVKATAVAANGIDTVGYHFISYQWTKLSGPACTITTPSALSTNITGMGVGVYKFRLRATDDNTGTISDTVTISVTVPGNLPPIANAGPDKTITLPTNTVTLVGSGTDPDGTIQSYEWTKISGPATYTIVSPTSSTTVINGLTTQGIYLFELKVTDNQSSSGRDTVKVTVNAAPNQSPVANAGPDKTITLPTNTVTVTGSGTDPDGTIASYAWTKIAGPTQYTIVSPTLAQTVINNLVQGVYQFELRVTDNVGAIDRDTVVITVNAQAPNQPPVANAGADKTITLPTNTVTLTGTGTDPDGTIASYLWTKIAGPATYTIVSPTLAQTVINNLVQGVYQFELRVTDNLGAIDRDTVIVTVNAAPVNQPPVANAGTDKTITLPVNTVTVTGSGTDPDGTIAGFAWTKISGPTQYTIASPGQSQTAINNLVQGVYQFALTVTDNLGATDMDTMMVTVNAGPPPPNQTPTANAGPDKAITLPVNTVTLTGSGTDPDGTIASYLWTKIAGPTSYTIVSPTQAQTVINNLVLGTYQFELRVTDNAGAIDRDTVVVTVYSTPPPPNQAPTANAGADKVITLPTNAVTVVGSGTDADGTIASYLWTKIAGPGQYAIVTPAQAQTVINNLVQGVYQFELRVTDNMGAIGKDTVRVTVNPATAPNILPIANAGPDKSITLPTNDVNILGSGTDPDGTIVGYLWTKVSGPLSYTIVSPTTPTTIINNLVVGTYKFELRVTDNRGGIDRDTVEIVVADAAKLEFAAKVFPNPATGGYIDVQITCKVDVERTKLEIVDAKGIVIHFDEMDRSVPTVTKRIDVSKYLPGIYFIKINVDGGKSRTTLKFIKQ